MAWPRQNNEPTDFFGLKPEEVKAKLDAGEKAVTEIAGVKSELEATKTSLASIQATLGTITEKLTPPEPTNRNDGGNNDGDDPNDPEVIARKRDQFVVGSAMESKAEKVFNDVARKLRKKDGVIFDNLEEEVRELLEKTPLQQRILPDCVENAYLIVKGRHTDEIATDRGNKKGKFYIESSQNQGGGGSNIPKTAAEQLSPAELKYAQRTGVTPEQYLAQKNKMNVFEEEAPSVNS